MYTGYGFPNVYAFIILVLIVLQWTMTPTGDPNNLVNNGGLFIITLFGLVLCSCMSSNPYRMPHYGMYYRRRGFLF
jgi:hypothetical protein